MPTLDDVAAMLKQQPYAVVSTIRPSGTVQSTLVNVGIYGDGIGFTTSGRTLKEYNLKRNPACTITIHTPAYQYLQSRQHPAVLLHRATVKAYIGHAVLPA